MKINQYVPQNLRRTKKEKPDTSRQKQRIEIIT